MSVDMVGRFKPQPSVYRRAAARDGAVHDGLVPRVRRRGARACGFKAAVYVNRYNLRFDDTPYLPQLTVVNFTELAAALL